MLNDPTVKLWFSQTYAYKQLVKNEEDDDLIRAVEEIEREEQDCE